MIKLISKYWITAVFIVILSSLVQQNFLINKFPFSLAEKQSVVDLNKRNNQLLIQQNKIKSIELKAFNAEDKEVLESQARYRFGLVKEGESYYQISDKAL